MDASINRQQLSLAQAKIALILDINLQLIKYAMLATGNHGANHQPNEAMFANCMKRLQCNIALDRKSVV